MKNLSVLIAFIFITTLVSCGKNPMANNSANAVSSSESISMSIEKDLTACYGRHCGWNNNSYNGKVFIKYYENNTFERYLVNDDLRKKQVERGSYYKSGDKITHAITESACGNLGSIIVDINDYLETNLEVDQYDFYEYENNCW